MLNRPFDLASDKTMFDKITALLDSNEPIKALKEKSSFHEAYSYLIESENVLYVLNKLERRQIPTFIQLFFRPANGNSLYQFLEEHAYAQIDAAVLCYVLISTNEKEINSPEIVRQAYDTFSPFLSTEMSAHLRGWFYFNNLMEKQRAPGFLPREGYYNLAKFDLEESNLRSAALDYANMQNTILSYVNLNDATLTHTNLSSAYLAHSQFNKANLSKANLEEVEGVASEYVNADLSGANMSKSDFDKAVFTGAILSDVTAKMSSFENATMNNIFSRHANFDNSSLIKINAAEAKFHSASFRKADLTQAQLNSASLKGSDLTNTNLSNADLTGVDLQSTILDGTNLNNAQLQHAHLFGAKIKNVKLNNTQFFTPDQIKNSEALKDELDWWQSELSTQPDNQRRLLRSAILNDLFAKTKDFSLEARRQVFDIAYPHALFDHGKVSFRKEMNKLFAPQRTKHPELYAPSPSQQLLREKLLPESKKISHHRRFR